MSDDSRTRFEAARDRQALVRREMAALVRDSLTVIARDVVGATPTDAALEAAIAGVVRKVT